MVVGGRTYPNQVDYTWCNMAGSRKCECPSNAYWTNNGCFGCNSGYGNCDNSWTNGCETALNTVTNCGACANTCTARTTCSLVPGLGYQESTYTATCAGSSCASPTTRICPATNQCNTGVCNAQGTTCTTANKADGTACTIPGAGSGTCQGGTCTAPQCGAIGTSCTSDNNCCNYTDQTTSGEYCSTATSGAKACCNRGSIWDSSTGTCRPHAGCTMPICDGTNYLTCVNPLNAYGTTACCSVTNTGLSGDAQPTTIVRY